MLLRQTRLFSVLEVHALPPPLLSAEIPTPSTTLEKDLPRLSQIFEAITGFVSFASFSFNFLSRKRCAEQRS
jgi:hypothetical protein